MCIRDLRIYSQGINGEVCHYRDETGLEVDAIITLPDGRWGAIEIKMGNRQVDEAFDNLTKLKNKVDTDIMNPPSFLMVLTGGQYVFRDKSGILIVPISCLRDYTYIAVEILSFRPIILKPCANLARLFEAIL